MNVNDTVFHKYFEGTGVVLAVNGEVATVLWSKTNSAWQHPIHTLKATSMPQIWKTTGKL